jgi:tetratricopeptide (TPR) repeat protein
MLGACGPAPSPTTPSGTTSAQPPVTQTPDCPPPAEVASLTANFDETLRTVDAAASLAMYEQAVRQDPNDPALLWKLALAYESQERWDAAATTFARAALLQPTQTRYWYRSGRAWIAQGAGGDLEAYDAAQEPLEKCVEVQPTFAECHFLLGEAEEWLDHEQVAAKHYGQAIREDPNQARYFLRLAELYLSFRLNREAEAVLKEGTRLVPSSVKNDPERCQLFAHLARPARLRGDAAAELQAMASAEALLDVASPEILFELGSNYALPEPPTALDQPRKEKAVTLLMRFVKRVCRGSKAIDYRDSCETASSFLQRLGP